MSAISRDHERCRIPLQPQGGKGVTNTPPLDWAWRMCAECLAHQPSAINAVICAEAGFVPRLGASRRLIRPPWCVWRRMLLDRLHYRCPILSATLTALALCSGACRLETEHSTTTWATVVDTLRDTIVVRTPAVNDSAARLLLVPELRIGELAGPDEYTFAEVGATASTSDGGVYVWDSTIRALRQYDTAGLFVRQIGRRGAGPGEYEAANGIVLLPNGLLLLSDPRNGRVNRYDTAGVTLGSWPMPSRLFTSRGLTADTSGNLYLAASLDRPVGSAEGVGSTLGLLRLTPDGALLDSLWPPVPGERPAHLTASRSGIMVTSDIPYSAQTVWAFSPLGYFVTGAPDRYTITLHRTDRLPIRIERDVAAVAVHPDEATEQRVRLTTQMLRVDPRWTWSGPDLPANKPFFRGLTVGVDGRIWAMRSMPGERLALAEADGEPPSRQSRPVARWREPVAFDVFEPDGRYVGFLPLPPQQWPLYMNGDTVWGIEKDSLDVPYVTRWRLSPAVENRRPARRGAP